MNAEIEKLRQSIKDAKRLKRELDERIAEVSKIIRTHEKPKVIRPRRTR
jgi:hypothetical protein